MNRKAYDLFRLIVQDTTNLFVVSLLLFIGVSIAQGADDPIVLYDFTETAGAIIHNRSPITPLLDLMIVDPTKVEWLSPGLRVKEATVAITGNVRTKLVFPKGITIEVWLKPANNTQDGPARVITFSADSGNRNFTFGQAAEHWDQRFRTSENPGNGNTPSLSTPAASIKSIPALQHVVYTRNEAGTAIFYIDGLKVQTAAIPGDLSNWDPSYGFGLFNEINFPTDTRTWLGDIFKVAIYGTVLTDAQVIENFNAGVPIPKTGTVTVAWDPNTEPDLAGYKIFYGSESRKAQTTAIADWCLEHEPTNEKCVQEWLDVCKARDAADDPACHTMLYDYDVTLDMVEDPAGRDPGCTAPYDPFKAECCEYTITGLTRGATYYLAGIAYDQEGNQSAFSEELIHIVAVGNPASPEKLIFKMPEQELSDSIKEITEEK